MRLPAFLEPGLRRFLIEKVERLDLAPSEDYASGEDSPDVRLGLAVSALLRDPGLCRVVGELIGEHVSGYGGCLSRHHQGFERPARWHGDRIATARPRLAGLIVDLSSAPFEGGEFQIRPKRDPDDVRTFAYRAPGDALLFRIGDEWQHRGCVVRSAAPKTILVGFFHGGPPLPGPYHPSSPRRRAAHSA